MLPRLWLLVGSDRPTDRPTMSLIELSWTAKKREIFTKQVPQSIFVTSIQISGDCMRWEWFIILCAPHQQLLCYNCSLHDDDHDDHREKEKDMFFLIMIALIAVAIWMMDLWPRECVHPSKSYYATATALNRFLYMHVCFVIRPFTFLIWHYG